MENIKNFAFKSTTSSLTERNTLFEQLFDVFNNRDKHEIPEAAFKLIARMNYYLFPIYIDKQSKENLITLNDHLIETNHDSNLKTILSALEVHAKNLASNHPSRSSSFLSLYGIDILNGIMVSLLRHKKTPSDEDLNKIALAYSNFCLGASENVELAYKKLKSLFSKQPDLVSKFEKSILADTDAPNQKLLFLGLLLRFYTEKNQTDSFNQLLNQSVKLYIDNLAGSRSKLPDWLVKSSNYMLRYITRDDFKDKFVPELKRSLLRSPEIIMQTLIYLFADLKIDLSDFSGDFLSPLGGQLISKDELLQSETALAFKSLSSQCSSQESIQKIIKHLFYVLNGGEGKLSTSNQKVSILTAIGNCTSNFSESSQDILCQLLQLFSDYLKTETLESTQVFAFQKLNKWLSSFKIQQYTPETIKKLNDFFKAQLEVKTYSNMVRSNIYHSMASIFSSQQIVSNIVNFQSQCMASIEKAHGQATQNNQMINEAMSASLVLAVYLSNDISNETKVPNYLNLVTDQKKQNFTNEKFLYSLNENGFNVFTLLCERLIEINGSKGDKLDLKNFYVGFLFVLMNPNYAIRSQAQEHLSKLLKWIPYSLIMTLIDLIEPTIEQFQLSTNPKLSGISDQNMNTTDTTDLNKWPSNKSVCELLLKFSLIKNLNKTQVEELTVKFVLLSNLRYCVETDGHLYEKCLINLLKQNPLEDTKFKDLIKSQTQILMHVTLDSETLNEKQLNAIETLSRLDFKNYLKSSINYALNILNENSSRLQTVTRQDYQIMNTKAGELFDKSLVEAFLKQQQETAAQANVRRENKTYSYKEQLADLELKKELEAKKGVKKDQQQLTLDQIRAQMSKKQQETLDLQIQKESKTRDEMLNLNKQVEKSTQILLHLIKGSLEESYFYVLKIIRVYIKLLKSPLCVSSFIRVFKSIGFYDQVLYGTLRLAEPSFDLDSNWLEEPLDEMYKRLLKWMNEETAFNPTKSALYYPFIKFAHTQRTVDENDLKTIVEIISKFCADRLGELNYHVESSIPDFRFVIDNFPSREYIQILLNIIDLLDENRMSVNLQNKTSDTTRSLIEFTNKILTQSELDLLDSKDEFLISYNSELNELVQGLFSECFAVRETCLKSIHIIVNNRNVFLINGPKFLIEESIYDELRHRLVISCHDVVESNQEIGKKIWKEGGFESDESLCVRLTQDIVHVYDNVRMSSANALAALIKEKHVSIIESIIRDLIEKYKTYNVVIEPKKDQFGRVNPNEQAIDEFEKREGIAQALVNLSETIPTSNSKLVLDVFNFFVYLGLNDRNQMVRNKMLEASVACLNTHGKSNINSLLPLFETFLQDAPKDGSYDSVRQNVVILMGTLAKHLDKDDQKVAPIIGKLIQALQTPSQQVQEAVANCLPPLMGSIKSQVPTYIDQLLNLLLSASTYGERRGAAYGLSGMLKGVGMLSLRQLNVLQRLNDAVNNKQDAKKREGALIGYEMLCVIFGKVFEPYSVEILPNLLICFGDTDENVRQAADDCAKAIMANLSNTGVKMILPKLLERLGDEESWRTKCGSVELLGSMAHCAPKQLSACLPNIVPKLIEVLSDSHVKVQKAGAQALRHIGSVIKNPEIQAISNVLLEALQDPADKTSKALQVLLDTKFVHFIDAPSLALIMPVVKRAFQDRSTEIRKMAAQIMGNMYSLTDQKDLLPYLPSILPGLKLSLLDPVPEVRTVSSKALGAMIKAIGENGLSEIISWLMEKLVSETSSVDRSGAAQGLSEVFGALGASKLEKSMPEIIDRAAQVDLSPFVRDGYMMMFIYLPLTFGDSFVPYVGLIIQPILKALADDSEFVRDTAIKAGQRIVNTYAETAISLFLPELEKGLFDSNWRIRFSSVQLLGDLLYKVSGVIGKMTTESAHEDDNFGTEKGSQAIIRALGEERRNRIYSGLYMGRSDTSLQVRQAALHVWKIIVSNTPKTLKEILPTLFNLLLGCLASSNSDKRQIAAATLVDIVKKLGERILPDIIPIFEKGLNTDRSDQRQGVCIALSEIMANTSRDNVIAFSDSLIPTVRQALMDPLPEVRVNAAKTFDNLHSMIGVKALEEVCLSLYDEMKGSNKERSERSLDALRQIMLVKSRAILPFLIPHLTQPPVNINALCKLCCATSTEVLSKHLSKILTTLMQALAETSSSLDSTTQISKEESDEWIRECEELLLSIDDYDGIKTIVNELIHTATQPDKPVNVKSAALDMLSWFCAKTEADFSDFYDDLLKALLQLFSQKNQSILEKAWLCVNHIIQPLTGSDLTSRLPAIRQSIRLLSQFHLQNTSRVYNSTNQLVNVAYLPGFCLPKKGISCILPVFKEGLLNGAPDVKEQSALTLCECIKLSDGDSLKSSVMAITGPLIRILGERYSWSVKSAILDAIYFLLLKVDVTLKPFLPQLQPTFIKNLSDANRTVRLKSGYGLAKLLAMNPKMDQIVLDLVNLTKNASDPQIKETLLNTLRLCINSIGAKLSEETKQHIFSLLKTQDYFYSSEQTIRSVSAGVLGSLAAYLSDKDFELLLNELIDFAKYTAKSWTCLQSNCMCLVTVLQYSPDKCKPYETKIVSFLKSSALSDRAPVAMSAIRAICAYLDYQIKNGSKSDVDLVTVLAKCINQSSNEIKLLSVQIVTYLSVINSKVFDTTLIKHFVPMLVNGTREKASSVRSASEIALIKMLRLKTENSIYDEALNSLDTMKDSFEDCVRSLSKESYNAQQTINIDEFNIDETLLKLDS